MAILENIPERLAHIILPNIYFTTFAYYVKILGVRKASIIISEWTRIRIFMMMNKTENNIFYKSSICAPEKYI